MEQFQQDLIELQVPHVNMDLPSVGLLEEEVVIGDEEEEDTEEDLEEEEHFERSDNPESSRNSRDSDEPDYLLDPEYKSWGY